MRLDQAIKTSKETGQWFRRADWDDECMWMHVSLDRDGTEFIEFVSGADAENRRFAAHVSDLCATNWELRAERPILLTRTDFLDAVRAVQTSPGCMIDATKLRLRLGL